MSLCYERTSDKIYVAPLPDKNSQQIWLKRTDSPHKGSIISVILTIFVTCSSCYLVYLGTITVWILCRGDHRLGKHVIYPNCSKEDVLQNKLQALKALVPTNDISMSLPDKSQSSCPFFPSLPKSPRESPLLLHIHSCGRASRLSKTFSKRHPSQFSLGRGYKKEKDCSHHL